VLVMVHNGVLGDGVSKRNHDGRTQGYPLHIILWNDSRDELVRLGPFSQ
jgi:hypothetical protein